LLCTTSGIFNGKEEGVHSEFYESLVNAAVNKGGYWSQKQFAIITQWKEKNFGNISRDKQVTQLQPLEECPRRLRMV